MMVRLLVVMTWAVASSTAFTVHRIQQQHPNSRSTQVRAARPRSTVQDPDGPTLALEQPPVEEVSPDDVEGLREIFDASELPHPIAHQPWRRGDTNGCEAPITAPWRLAAEEVITKAVMVTGGRVLDVTWFLTAVLVTLDDTQLPEPDQIKDRGPVIEIEEPGPAVYQDPADPNPEDIWDEDDDVMYERETEEQAEERKNRQEKMWATVSEDDEDPTEPHIPNLDGFEDIGLYRNKETRQEVAPLVTDAYQEREEENQQPMGIRSMDIDTNVLSGISYAILQALEPHEKEWHVLSRHELVLSSPNPALDVLETQRQFDANRDAFVAVYTQDPFESNRTLKGQLVDRNSMDLILNIQGNMVTVPHNFIKCVRLPPNADVPGDVPGEEEASSANKDGPAP